MNIKEVSQLTGLSSDTIRYYERIGLLPPIARTHSGIRKFSGKDVAILEFIHCFRATGMSISSLTKYMHLISKGDSSLLERRQLLEEERSRLMEERMRIDQSLERLQQKISDYQETLAKMEKNLFTDKEKK
ncbi:MerR family transcriptional regulator [Streptococcus suis]|nr:MerR family transcriptional regulator [Streptococcus suis]